MTSLMHGVAEISDDYYFFRFPKTECTWETWMKINRYTGEFYREWGDPPFFRDFFTEGNVVQIGKCEVSDAEQLF